MHGADETSGREFNGQENNTHARKTSMFMRGDDEITPKEIVDIRRETNETADNLWQEDDEVINEDDFITGGLTEKILTASIVSNN